MTIQHPVVTLSTIEDGAGKRLDDVVTEMLMEAERHTQSYANAHAGDVPIKPYKIRVELEVQPKANDVREITATAELYYPKCPVTQFALGVSDGGVIVGIKPARQQALRLERSNGE